MTNDLFTILERVSNLLRGEARRVGQAFGLAPLQHDALYYLSICNQYSDTPLAVAEFLGLTKGTVSQTLKVLENKDLISKTTDSDDRRIVHLALTAQGKRYINQSIPPESFTQALETIPAAHQQALLEQLKALLLAYQYRSGREGFGVCKQCKHYGQHNGEFICGLTKDRLSIDNIELICREYQ